MGVGKRGMTKKQKVMRVKKARGEEGRREKKKKKP